MEIVLLRTEDRLHTQWRHIPWWSSAVPEHSGGGTLWEVAEGGDGSGGDGDGDGGDDA